MSGVRTATAPRLVYEAGVVLGRFEPFHPGHAHLVATAFAECERVTVLVGSAQLDDPFPIERRLAHLDALLRAAYSDREWRLDSLADPEPMAAWPLVVARAAGTYPGPTAFFRADPLDRADELTLNELGCIVCYVERRPFVWIGPEGRPVRSSSSTDVKRAYAEAGRVLENGEPGIPGWLV